MDVEYSETTKGKPLALHLGYMYSINRKTENATYWECRQAGCKGRLITKTHNNAVEVTREHSHGPDDGVLEVEKCKVKCRKRASEELTPIPFVYAQEYAKIADAGINLVAPTQRFTSVDSSLYKIRKKALSFPTTFKNREDISLTGEWTVTSNGEKFLVLDDGKEDKILAFASPKCRTVLEQVTLILMDGTFKSCPSQFKQLYTLHGDVGSNEDSTQVIPLLYALLPDKKKITYCRLFQRIRTICPNFHPTTIKMDFESAAIHAVKEVLPNTEVSGCNFHFNQCLWRKIQDLGLVKLYREDAEVKQHVRKIAALAYLPVHMMNNGWTNIMADSPANPKVIEFNDYFVETWLEDDTFSVIWNCSGQRHRTTNTVEGWHNRINKWIGNSHPNIFQFISAIKMDEALARLSLTQRDTGIEVQKRKKAYRTGVYFNFG